MVDLIRGLMDPEVTLGFLRSWAGDLVVVVALAAIIEMLLPRGDLKRFGRLVMGLFVLLALVKPFLGLLQVPVSLPADPLPGARGSGGYGWGDAAPAGTGGRAAWTDFMATQLEALVARGLGLRSGEVRAEVDFAAGQGGWPGRPERVRIEVLRQPPALAEAADERAVAGEGPPRGERAAAALAAQIAAIYRLTDSQVEVIIPR